MSMAEARREWLAWALVLAVVLWVVPKRVIVHGDDFGYIESVALTIQAGRLEQSDWLGPFNVVLPLIGAAIYKVAGSFWASTEGLLIALAAANFWLLRRWLAACDLRDPWIVPLIALFPTWMAKSVEFTGVPLSLFFLLAALLAWKGGRKGLFFGILLVAVANRQGLVCLLALPLAELVRRWVAERRMDGFLIAGGLVVATEMVLLEIVYPPTFAREVVAAGMRTDVWSVLFPANLVFGLIALNGIRTLWSWLKGESPREVLRENLARPAAPLAVLAAGIVASRFGGAALAVETPGLNAFGALATVGLVFGGACLGRWRSFPAAETTLCVVIYAVLVALRGQWWDYYLLEPAVVLAAAGSRDTTPAADSRRWLLLSFAGVWLFYAVFIGGYLRRQERTLVGYELALRRGEVQVQEMSEAPFGYLGWKLFNTAKTRGTGNSARNCSAA